MVSLSLIITIVVPILIVQILSFIISVIGTYLLNESNTAFYSCYSCNTPKSFFLLLHKICYKCGQYPLYNTFLFRLITQSILFFFIAPLFQGTAIDIHFYFYLILMSILLITVRTDMDRMLVAPEVTIYLLPFIFLASYTNFSPLSLKKSIIGALLGYFLPWSINAVYMLIKKKNGMGQGDFYVLSVIGAVLGPLALFPLLFFASLLGTSTSLIYMLFAKKTIESLPFCPFLIIVLFFIIATKYCSIITIA